MGWFWDSKESTRLQPGDAYSKLDPALKAYLDRESPLRYEDTQPRSSHSQRPSPDAAPDTYRTQLGLHVPGVSQDNQNASTTTPDRPAVPPQSLFQDGRYAHLWRDYRPQAEIENASMSDQDKLAAVVEAYKNRKAAIGRAAVENCVTEQLLLQECFRSGDVKRLMTMCRAENRGFNRCYEMQNRFLKALGYLSVKGRTEEAEERIQMHADKLYHEMLERERVAEEMRRDGQEVPAFAPLLPNTTEETKATTRGSEGDGPWARAKQNERLPSNFSLLSEKKQKQIREALKDKTGMDRELELQLLEVEAKESREKVQQLQAIREDDEKKRADRRDRGRESVGDSIRRMWEGR